MLSTFGPCVNSAKSVNFITERMIDRISGISATLCNSGKYVTFVILISFFYGVVIVVAC